jgi:hypothetical protein
MAGVTDYIVNPRRAPRAPSRCKTKVQSAGAAWDSETEDIGPHGCQLLAPAPLARGAALQIVVGNRSLPLVLQVAGRVAWVSSQPPWRLGVAFEKSAQPAATRWFEQLVGASPGLANVRRVPERLPTDAMIFLGAPPKFADFTPDEVEVLRHVAGGLTVARLRQKLEATWPVALRSLFALLGRGAVTVARGAAAQPETWRAVMEELGAEFAVEAPPPRLAPLPSRTPIATPGLDLPPPGRPAPVPTPPPVPPLPHPAVAPPPVVQHEPLFDLEAISAAAEADEIEVARPDYYALPGSPPAGSAAPPPPRPPAMPGTPGVSSAGTGWRGAGRARSQEAQEALDLGLQELAAGRTSSALAHLRNALRQAPGDAEVAAALGRAMKGG